MTPWQLRIRIEAFGEVASRDWKLRLAGSWHTAVFTRVERLQPLQHYIRDTSRANTPALKSPEDCAAMLVTLNAAFGGIDKRPKKPN